jgi:molecular chaperone HtpG
VDECARTLTFSDNGTGMDRQDIEEFLSVIGSTGTGSRARELAARDVAVATIGQFGIGLLSAFVVAERIEVQTRKPMATQAWRWVNHGGEDYELDALPANAQPSGTRVTVTLAAGSNRLSRRSPAPPDRAPLRRFPAVSDPAERLRSD